MPHLSATRQRARGNGSATAGGTVGASGPVPTAAQTPLYGALGPAVNFAGGSGTAVGRILGPQGSHRPLPSTAPFSWAARGAQESLLPPSPGAQFQVPVFAPRSPEAWPGPRGGAGFELWMPPTFCGGSGGGSSDSAAGGAGGNGGPGCGAGGGGAGLTGGIGGRGGKGFVLIAWTF